MGKIQLIDAETLYYKPLEHPKMLIDGVLSDGLAIMAGDSKIGKSWMVLSRPCVCRATACGGRTAENRLPTPVTVTENARMAVTANVVTTNYTTKNS